MAASNLALLAQQYFANRGGFRRYVHEQAFLALPPFLLQAAQQLIPAILCRTLGAQLEGGNPFPVIQPPNSASGG